MDEAEFEEHVRAALDLLPDDIARGLENVAVVIEDESPRDPSILGSFYGHPRGERTPPGALPAKVVIYRRPLEEEFGADPAELESEVRITVLHELAHYFGLDEEQLEQLGYQ